MFGLEPDKIIYINEQSKVERAVSDILCYDIRGFDTETYGPKKNGQSDGLHPFLHSRMRLSQFAIPTGLVYVFDHFRVDKRYLYSLFPRIGGLTITQNGKFDLSFLKEELNIQSYAELADTMLMGQLTSKGDIGGGTRYDLATLAWRYLEYELPKDEQVSDWSARELSPSQIKYAGQDAWILLPLYEAIFKKLEEQSQLRVMHLEHNALPAFAEMERNGMFLNQDRWMAQFHQAQKDVVQYEEHLFDYFDGISKVGHGSKKGKGVSEVPTLFKGARSIELTTTQLKEAFAIRGVELPIDDNGNPTLRDFKVQGAIARGEYDEADVAALKASIAYRKVSKLMESYGPSWFDFICPKCGNIHQSYKQIGADTGRVACFEPNLQQIPKLDAYRNAFEAGEGWLIVDTDYSQMELRILAEYCRDPAYLRAFDNKLDLHTYTASLIYKIGYEIVEAWQRDISKNMNFLIVYGGGILKLAESTGITPEEAQVIMDLYLKETYPQMAGWLRAKAARTVATMRAETMTGRIREFWGDKEDRKTRSTIERGGKNHPIQGTSVDIVKRALHLIYEQIKHRDDIKMLHVVHDEVLLKARPWAAREAKAIQEECMLKAEGEYLWRVKPAVETSITYEWTKKATKAQIEYAERLMNQAKWN